jgi:hypothetical protein
MPSTSDEQEMRKRLRELEEENARLRSAVKPSASAKLVVTESEYKGHPTLTFEGPVRPFSLGLRKLQLIKEAWPEIESFLQRHAKTKPSESKDDE